MPSLSIWLSSNGFCQPKVCSVTGARNGPADLVLDGIHDQTLPRETSVGPARLDGRETAIANAGTGAEAHLVWPMLLTSDLRRRPCSGRQGCSAWRSGEQIEDLVASVDIPGATRVSEEV
jgi:hypothetical protein